MAREEFEKYTRTEKKKLFKCVTSRNTNSKPGSLQDGGYPKFFVSKSYLHNPVDLFFVSGKEKKITFANFILLEFLFVCT